MQRRMLSPQGPPVSVIALGAVKLGRAAGLKYPGAFSIPDDDAARRLLDAAADLGVNLIDTAPAYGSSEERLGALLRTRREHWIISTKAGEEFDEGTAQSRYDFTPAALRASIERSLARLRTDRLDVVLLHLTDGDEMVLKQGDALGTLRDLQRQGKVRLVGASTKSVEAGRIAAVQCDVVMLTLNRAACDDEPAALTAAQRAVGVLAKKALRSGHDDPEAAIRHALAVPGVTSVVVGTINPDHLQQLVRAAERNVPPIASRGEAAP